MRRDLHVFMLFLFVLFGATACDSSETTVTTGGGGAGAGGGAGGGGAGGAGQEPTAYDPTHLLEVAVTMPVADWDELRFQANDVEKLLGGDCLAGPKETMFTYFHAAVSIDGQEFPDVAIRKKGFIGSLSVSKPSLKIKLDEYDPEARFADTDRLTLNNMKQDATHIRTCLALELFAQAGVPASRCSFAHVTVNGQDLGVYANIEGVDKSMLKRHFSDETGNLYEGQMSDFRPEWVNTLEKKTNETDPDRSDIEALTEALLAPDAELLAKVEPLVDVDAFVSYWAMEAILASWDGYTGGQNNFQVYHDPTSGKLFFLPWGPDATFDADTPLAAADAPKSLFASSALPNRLYEQPSIRTKYRDRLLALLDEVMNPDVVLPEIDRMEALVAPLLDDAAGAWKGEIDSVRQFVKGRPAVLKAELADGPVDFTYPISGFPCFVDVGLANGTFSTKMGTLDVPNPFTAGTGTLYAEIYGQAGDAGVVGSAIGPDENTLTLTVVGSMPDGKLVVVVFLIDPTVYAKAATLPIDAQQAFGVAGTVGQNNQFVLLGFLSGGTLTLDEAGLADGDAVQGSFEATILGPPL